MQPWLAAHALGEAGDDAAAQAHLAACPHCRRDLGEYRRVAGLLPYAAPDAAPAPELRDRVVAAVAREAGAPETGSGPLKPRPVVRRPFFSRASWAALAFAALAVALLGWNLALRAQVAEQAGEIAFHRQGWRTTIELLNDSSVRWYVVSGGGAIGHLWATPVSQDACFVAEGLPSIDEGQVLQVWAARAGKSVSVGTFEPHEGSGWVMLWADAPIAAYESIFVTIEPSGGSAAPSGPPVMSGSLAAAVAPSLADRQELLRLLVNGAHGNA